MNKYQVSVFFSVDEEFMNLVPKHRGVISDMILKGVIDSYAISAEVGRGWITMNGKANGDERNLIPSSSFALLAFSLTKLIQNHFRKTIHLRIINHQLINF